MVQLPKYSASKSIKNLFFLVVALAGLAFVGFGLYLSLQEKGSPLVATILEKIGECLFLIGSLHVLYELFVKKSDEEEMLKALDSKMKFVQLNNLFTIRLDILQKHVPLEKLDRTIGNTIHHLSNIAKEMDNHQLPQNLKNICHNSALEKVLDCNKELEQIEKGNIKVTHNNTISATFSCMEGVSKSAFAVSFPDLTLWNGERGREYLKIQERAMKRHHVKISRYFIIPRADSGMLQDNRVRDFIDNLNNQIQIGIKVYLQHESEVLLENLNLKSNRQRKFIIPDVSLYDDRIASEWADKENGVTSETIISYGESPYLVDAHSVFDFFMKPKPGSDVMANVEMLQNRIEEIKLKCA